MDRHRASATQICHYRFVINYFIHAVRGVPKDNLEL